MPRKQKMFIFNNHNAINTNITTWVHCSRDVKEFAFINAESVCPVEITPISRYELLNCIVITEVN